MAPGPNEPVQFKYLQANARSHKAVPLGLLHPSTSLLMTVLYLSQSIGPLPGPGTAWKHQWRGAAVCEACYQDLL